MRAVVALVLFACAASSPTPVVDSNRGDTLWLCMASAACASRVDGAVETRTYQVCARPQSGDVATPGEVTVQDWEASWVAQCDAEQGAITLVGHACFDELGPEPFLCHVNACWPTYQNCEP